MCSETSDEDIYITQSTFCQESDLGDVNDWLLDGLSIDEQMLTDNVEKQKVTAENRFANPISDVEIQSNDYAKKLEFLAIGQIIHLELLLQHECMTWELMNSLSARKLVSVLK